MNPQFEAIGNGFAKTFYDIFQSNRAQLITLYGPEALLTFEGIQIRGPQDIMGKYTSLQFQSVLISVTKTDCQPLPDGGVFIMVFGQLKADNDQPLPFSQSFILRPHSQTFMITNDIFRLGVHDQAAS